jgi:hypothetical protein
VPTRDELIDACTEEIGATFALDADEGHSPPERVVLALDTRDPLARDLAAQLEALPHGSGQPLVDAHAAALARLETLAIVAPEIRVFPAGRAGIVTMLDAAGFPDEASDLESIEKGALVMVALGGVTVRGVSVQPAVEAG